MTTIRDWLAGMGIALFSVAFMVAVIAAAI